jgi:gliding motility-associated-like protein
LQNRYPTRFLKLTQFLLSLTALIVVHLDLNAQSSSSKSFFRTYGLTTSDYGTWVCETSDQGYLLSFNSPYNSLVAGGLVKTDCSGEILWQHLYTANNENILTKQVEEINGSFYVFGAAGNTLNNAQLYFARLSADGTLQQAKYIRCSPSDNPARFLHASDGTWWLISTGDNNVDYENICVTHLDYNLNFISSKKYSLPQKELIVESAALTPDGELVLCGDYSSGSTFRNAFVMRIGVAGELRWFSSISHSFDVFLNDVVTDATGFSYASGYMYDNTSGWDAIMVKFNTTGDLSGQVQIDIAEDDRFRSLVYRDGNLLLLGDFGTFDDRNIFWLKINTTNSSVGDPVQLVWGDPYTNYPYKVVAGSAGSWLFTGDFAEPSGVRNAGLVRLDTYYQLPCNTLAIADFTHEVGTFTDGIENPFIQNIQTQVTDASFTDLPLIYSTTSVCGVYSPSAAASFKLQEDCPLSCAQFTDQSLCNPTSWSWEFPDGDPLVSSDPNPTVCYNSQGQKTVYLTVSNSDGSSSTSFTVEVKKDCPLIIPNTFSPNGDGINDLFIIIGLKSNSTFYVYDRWGKKVFASTAYTNNWDGKIQDSSGSPTNELISAGVYFYALEAPDGSKNNGYIQVVR